MTGLLFCYHIGMKYYVYILRCTDGTLYTGFSTDPEKRLKTHNTGKGAKYTKTRRPVELVYYEVFASKNEAMKREAAIKKLSRTKKLEMIQNGLKEKRD